MSRFSPRVKLSNSSSTSAISSWFGNQFVAVPGDYYSIATANGTGSSGTITFSSIPATFSHLQVRLIANMGATNNFNIRFNGDTTSANYIYHQIYGDGTNTGAGASVGLPFAGYATTSYYGISIIDIFDYANTNKNKTISTIHGSDANGSGFSLFRSGLWLNTAAINQIEIVAGTNFTTASKFALYGIKG